MGSPSMKSTMEGKFLGHFPNHQKDSQILMCFSQCFEIPTPQFTRVVKWEYRSTVLNPNHLFHHEKHHFGG